MGYQYLTASNIYNVSYVRFPGEPASSVSTVSGYELDDRAIEVRSPAEAKGYFL
jgi:hypothetical protein